jgi:hypothetical protein
MRKAISQQISSLEKQVDEALGKITALDESVKRSKNSDVKEMIKYHVERTDEVETRRGKTRDLALQMLGICTTGLGLLVSQSAKVDTWVFWTLAGTLGCEILASIVVLVVHDFQAAFRYPFLQLEKHGNTWKWFYRGNRAILRMSACPLATSCQMSEALVPYLQGLAVFIENYTAEDLDQELMDNLRQLYLLIAHNYYKNQFYLQLTRIWKWGGTVIPAFILVLGMFIAVLRALG